MDVHCPLYAYFVYILAHTFSFATSLWSERSFYFFGFTETGFMNLETSVHGEF